MLTKSSFITRGGGDILETLMRHHVAPMTRGIADREQDRLFGLLRCRQGFRSPGPPLDRVVPVLQEIGTGLLREVVLLVGRHLRRR